MTYFNQLEIEVEGSFAVMPYTTKKQKRMTQWTFCPRVGWMHLLTEYLRL